jgi:hypothetical protein
MQAGAQYNSWTVMGLASDAGSKMRWLCRCVCGVEKIVDAYSLTTGRSRSCRKCSAVVANQARRTHGKSRTKVYRAWQSIKTRCYNPKAWKSYQYHGAYGVTMYAGWVDDFEAFAAYVGEPPTPLHTIDRKDANGNYEPGNIRWATQHEQMQNTRRAKKCHGLP